MKTILKVTCCFLLLFAQLLPAFSGNGKVKNIVFFIGDGMPLASEVAASRYLTGENTSLAWHDFPYMSFVSTWDINTYNNYALDTGQKSFSYKQFFPTVGYDPDKGGLMPYPLEKKADRDYFLTKLPKTIRVGWTSLATDSGASATAMATGIKTETGNVSWLPGDASDGRLKSITELLREQKGASFGIVTTVPFNHATPGAFIAHNTSRRNYYSDKMVSEEGTGITEEIIRNTKPDVVIGAGHPEFISKSMVKKYTYLNKELYEEIKSLDGYVFVERQKGKSGSEAVLNASEKAVNNNLKLFGLFGDENDSLGIPVALENPGNPSVIKNKENPAFKDAVTAALNVLSQNDKGFFLVAEQGTIDWANHNNDYKRMIGSTVELNNAVDSAIEFVEKPGDNIDWSNTLLIVTSDHSIGYLRLKEPEKLCKGCLPTQIKIINYFYPGDEIQYSTRLHTNELVCLYVKGEHSEIFKEVEDLWYPGTKIIDNTHIFDAFVKALGLEYDKRKVFEENNYKLPKF